MKLLYSLLGKSNLFFCLIAIAIIVYSCQVDSKETNLALHNNDLDFNEVPDVIDFNFHIKPILSDRCFKCHGPDKNKIEAGLSFFSFESATLALGEEKDHFAIVPFKPEESELITRINATDPGERMPPPESNLSLNAHEKKLLSKWIEQGAVYKKHWSLLPIVDVPPKFKHESEWVYNDIDRYILDKLELSPLQPSAKAKKEY